MALFQIVIIEHKSIICPGYNAVLHIHTCIEEVQITVSSAKQTVFISLSVCVHLWDTIWFLWTAVEFFISRLQALICLMDKKTGEKSKIRPRFVKQEQVCIARLRAAGVICLETFKDFPQMGRFTLRDEGGKTVRKCLFLSPKSTKIWMLFHIFLRENHRHRQGAEAGARKGLNAATAACMKFFDWLQKRNAAREAT